MASIEKRSEKSYRLIVDDPAYSSTNRKQIKKSVKITDEALLRNQRKLQQYLQKELPAFYNTYCIPPRIFA